MSIFAVIVSALQAADPAPSSSPTADPSLITTSPGTIGWVMTSLVAVGAVFLIFDMTRRIRRVRYREEILEGISEEQAAIEEAAELAREQAARDHDKR